MDEQLKSDLEKEATRLGGVNMTALMHEALRQYLARRCPTCGGMYERVNPGLTEEFQRWLAGHDREAIYIIYETGRELRAYKGRFFRSQIRERTLTLSAASSKWRHGDATFLRARIVDWRPGDNATDNDGCFEKQNPGIKLDNWGLDK